MSSRDNSFGKYLKAKRGELKLSQRALATSLGVDFSYVSKLENGHEEPPSEETLRRLAVELKVPEDRLLAMAGKLPAELRQRAVTDPEFAYLLTRLPEVSKRSLSRIFRAAGIDPPRFP
jgi:transcriptional regulator with XRE-family HTH domain